MILKGRAHFQATNVNEMELKGNLSILRDLDGSGCHENHLNRRKEEHRSERLEKQLQEERERSHALSRENKDLKGEKKMLEGLVSLQWGALNRDREEKKVIQKEKEYLEVQLEQANALLSKAKERFRTAKSEGKRMNGVVTTLCNDLLGAHNGMEVAHMKTRHAEERCREAEDRLARERTDVNCIASRIEELRGLQQIMLDLTDETSMMSGGAVKSSPGKKRGKMGSMLRQMLSKLRTRKRVRRGISSNDKFCNSQEKIDVESPEQGRPWEIPHRSNDNDDVTLGRNNPEHFEDLQRGAESKTLWGFRQDEKDRRDHEGLMREGGEELHRLVTEDITMLSEIIKKKSDVIEEMETALADMRMKMNWLEEKLQNQREGKRKKKWMKDSRHSIIRTLENELVRRSRNDVSGWCPVRGSGTVGERGTIR